jgi:cyclopropane-fatty-acyl-phospholipid synthase
MSVGMFEHVGVNFHEMNFQIQLTKRQGIVSMTRDYIWREEARLRAREQGSLPQLKMAGE